jgi:hypothetical protein
MAGKVFSPDPNELETVKAILGKWKAELTPLELFATDVMDPDLIRVIDDTIGAYLAEKIGLLNALQFNQARGRTTDWGRRTVREWRYEVNIQGFFYNEDNAQGPITHQRYRTHHVYVKRPRVETE